MTEGDRASFNQSKGTEGIGHDVTDQLNAWSNGDVEAGNKLFEWVYPELRRLAQHQLSKSLWRLMDITEVVHATYLKLVDQRQRTWKCRAQFFALASTLIRRLLMDQTKTNRRLKRGEGNPHLSLEEFSLPGIEPTTDMLVLDGALVELARIQVTAVRIIELRIFVGLNAEETAEVLGLSRRTVLRKWRFAKAWLSEYLGGGF